MSEVASRASAAMAYWRDRLDSMPGAPELPLVVSPRDVQRPVFVRRSRRIPASTWRRVKKLASGHGVTASTTLLAAYDDAEGITAAFNLNLLARINRELDGTIPLDSFRHRAIWNDDRARIEMHLEATADADFTVDGRHFSIAEGETIHTENSHKYGPRDARILLRSGGWTPIGEWTDPDDRYTLYLAEAQPERPAP